MSKHTLKLFYSVQNGGDGSAYPEFFESMELAQFDQDHMEEGWGESCTGTITLESDSPITAIGLNITTKDTLIKEIEDDIGHMKKFYPDGSYDKYIKNREKELKELKKLETK